MSHLKYLSSIILLFLIVACSKEQFTSTPKAESSATSQVQVYEQVTCSNHTLVKPAVDILFVVDNSTSSSYMTEGLKAQIANTIQTISQEFDFHILVAPLIKVTNSESQTGYQLAVSSTDGLNPVSLNITQPDQITFFSLPSGGQQEAGLARAKEIIDANMSNNVFRVGANTIVVMVSNGDDNSVQTCAGGYCSLNTNAYSAALTNLKKYSKNTTGSTLKSESFRFLSVITKSACQSGATANVVYKQASKDLYAYSGATDQAGKSEPDSYDICTNEYSSLFTSVNNSIHQLVLAHKYDFWPVTNNTSANIDTQDIQVTKVKQDGTTSVVALDGTNGFQYVGARTNQNTRYAPTPGEPETGLFVQLFGNGRVTYPDCVVIKTRTPTEYYGYVVISSAPQVDTIAIRIRGQDVPADATNGWSYAGYKDLQNIKVVGPNGESDQPAVQKTGYFIKLNGSSLYSSGDTVEVYYKAAAI